MGVDRPGGVRPVRGGGLHGRHHPPHHVPCSHHARGAPRTPHLAPSHTWCLRRAPLDLGFDEIAAAMLPTSPATCCEMCTAVQLQGKRCCVAGCCSSEAHAERCRSLQTFERVQATFAHLHSCAPLHVPASPPPSSPRRRPEIRRCRGRPSAGRRRGRR